MLDDDIQLSKNSSLIIRGRALVRLGDRLLFVSKNEKEWFLPGGDLLPNEDLIQCTERTVYDTSGLLINPGRLYSMYESYDSTKKIHGFECIFICRFKTNEKSVDDHAQKVLSSPYHKYLTLEEIIQEDNVFPRFLQYGHWTHQNKDSIRALYNGLICIR